MQPKRDTMRPSKRWLNWYWFQQTRDVEETVQGFPHSREEGVEYDKSRKQ